MSTTRGARSRTYPADDPREVAGWVAYDWANSAFVTTVVTVLSGPYLTGLAQAAVGENGTVLDLGPLGRMTAKSFFPYCVSSSVLLQVLFLPFLGAVADYTHWRKRLMALFCYAGAAATCLLVAVTQAVYIAGGLLFVFANVCFGASIVLYNAFLNDVASEGRRNRVSSRGFAAGYLGGGLLLAANLALLRLGGRIGVPTDLAVRLSMLSAGLWWGGFATFTFRRLKARGAARDLPPNASLATVGARELVATFRTLRALPQTLRYLLAYMLYNDGIQTVVSLASVFLAQELFVARGRPVDQSFLFGLVLVVQFVAMGGALLFERLARVAGTKNAIALAVGVWVAVVLYAYGALRSTTDAWIMGVVIALVLGGSQALSRSLFSLMIPAGREAGFFGLYEISERGTSWIGPLIFGAVVGATGSYRQAILSLVVLFALGLALLLATNTRRAVAEAAHLQPSGAAAG